MAKLIFKAKVVGSNKQTVIAAIVTGCGIVPVVLCLSVHDLNKYVLHVFGVIILFVVLWILLNKGNESIYNLKKDMFVYEDHLEIETIIFPFQEINNLIFHFDAFQNMRPGSYTPSTAAELRDVHNGKDVFGLANTISFTYRKQKFKYDFHVKSQAHFFQFVQMLEILYQSHINFAEENWYGKTFLMQNVDADGYNQLKSQYLL